MANGQIHILGTVGVGKSTLSKILSKSQDMPLFPEPVSSNPYLEAYYAEPKKYAFPMQVFLAHARYKQALEAQQLDACIMDMSIYGNEIFAQVMHDNGDITDVDYALYKDLCKSFKELLEPPKLLVYLQCSTEVAIERIVKRGRPSEMKASINYWFQLNKAYEKWYEKYDLGKKILINVDNVNFVDNDRDREVIIYRIMEGFTNANSLHTE